MLAQVGAPDSDTGASVYRSSEWLHLLQDKDIHLYLPVILCGLRQPRPPVLSSVHPQHGHPPSKSGSEEETRRASAPTYRVNERCGTLSSHSLGFITGFPGYTTWALPLAPHTVVLRHGRLAAAAVPMSHRAVIQHH